MTKSFKNRPTGESLDEYRGHEKWSASHWAWQFLRRNEEFYAACKVIQKQGADESRKLEVARRFGLVRFKSASEPYSGEFKKPEFRVSTPRSYVRLTEGDKVKRPRPLDVGELVVRIDLRPALSHKGLLALQLKEVAKSAKASLLEFSRVSGADAPKYRRVARGKKASDLDLLRMLDLMFAGKARPEIVALLFPPELELKTSGKSWDSFYEGVKARAEGMTKLGYFKLIRVDSEKRPETKVDGKAQ